MKKNAIIGMMALAVMGLSGCGKQEITLVSDQIEIELGSALDETVTDYVELDAEEAAQASVDFSAVDVMTAGTYTANVIYGRKKVPFEVVVKDTTAPKYRINNPIVVELGELIYAKDVIDAITELSGKVKVSFEELEETEETAAEGTETINGKMEDNAEDSVVLDGVTFNNAVVTYTEIGTYEIKMTVMDESGNSHDVFVPIIVGESPVFEGIEDMTVTKGTKDVSYLDGVKATSSFDVDITDQITCNSDAVDLNEEGTYTITYTVTDQYGFKAESSATVTVQKGDASKKTDAGKTTEKTGSNGKKADAAGTGKASGTSTTSNASSEATGSNANSVSGKGNSENSSSGGQSVNSTPSKPDTGNSGKENSNNGGQTPAPTPTPSPAPDKGSGSSSNGNSDNGGSTPAPAPAPEPTPDINNGNEGGNDMQVPDGWEDVPVFDPSTNPDRPDEMGGTGW